MSSQYRVVLSARVSDELKAIAARAAALGQRRTVLDALKKIDEMLRFYPQYGEPLQDLATGGTKYIAAIPPLVIEYSVDESITRSLSSCPYEL